MMLKQSSEVLLCSQLVQASMFALLFLHRAKKLSKPRLLVHVGVVIREVSVLIFDLSGDDGAAVLYL